VILVTGGLGFFGGNLAKHFLDTGSEVLLTRNRNAQIPDLLAPYVGKGLEIAPMDVTSITTILDGIKRYNVTSIVHGAAIYEGRGSLYQVIDVNVMGTANILEAARIMNVGRVTFTSSEGVHQGLKGAEPLKEDEFVSIRSGRYIPATKKMAEILLSIYQKEYGLDMVITRPSRTYGPLYTAGINPILRMVTAALKGGEIVFSNIDESEGHDFVYVRDCVRALALIHLAERPRYDLYNIGLGRFHTFGDVSRIMEELLPGTTIKLAGGAATGPKSQFDSNAWVDCTRIREEFGYVPEYDLKKGVSALIAWLRDGKYV
jgi:UDP-glucose 4-epimerase